jgi:hypothetical protein
MRRHKLTQPLLLDTTYDGAEDPLGWLNQCEHFFYAQHTPEGDKVEIAAFHLTGVAQHWFYMLD